MEHIAMIEFSDVAGQGEGLLIIRAGKEGIAVCLSMRNDGDLECLIDAETGQCFVDAIHKAICHLRETRGETKGSAVVVEKNKGDAPR